MSNKNIQNKTILNPFFIMVLIYIIIALLEAIQIALTQFFRVPVMINFIWFSIHFITIGILTESVFGAVPLILAWRKNIRLDTNWNTWIFLNSGLITLIIGFSQMNELVIETGGSLIFIATFLLIVNIIKILQASDNKLLTTVNLFYLTGLVYLFIGIIIGVSLFTNFSGFWGNKSPLETHIHANSWGFLSLVFTGLIIDYFPTLFKEKLMSPRMEKVIYVFMTLGALGLVVGPWTGLLFILVPGLLLHIISSILLLYNLIKYVLRKNLVKNIGLLHFLSAYAWFFAPLIVSPFVLFKVPGFGYVESYAPQALIYGWALMVGVAFIPYFISKEYNSDSKATLGGTWITLIFLHLGSIFLWISIFTEANQIILGTAYLFWIIGFLAFFYEVYVLIKNFEEIKTALA